VDELSADVPLSVEEVPGVVALPPSCCVAGSGVPVVLEQATKLPDRSNATAAMDTHFLFMFIPLSFLGIVTFSLSHVYRNGEK